MATYLGPLTTTFTPPASCLQTATFYRAYDEPAVKLLDTPECFPSSYVSAGYYSPGSICPSGYRGVTENDGAVTSVNCCPSGFQFLGPFPGRCDTVETARTVGVYVTGDPTQATSTQYYPPSATFYASAIQVRYQSSDGATATSSVAATSSSTASASSSQSVSATSFSTSTGTNGAVTTVTSASSPSQSANSSGLSTGAKIGIGVAVPLAVVGLLAVGLILFRRQRNKQQRKADFLVHEMPSQDKYGHEKPPSEMFGSYVPPQQSPVEIDGRPK